MASKKTIDFSKGPDIREHASGNPQDGAELSKPIGSDGKLLTPKQIRARARRKGKRMTMFTVEETNALYRKPVEEWDLEELARGRPRNSRGGFTGTKPGWVSPEVHEAAMEKYILAVKTDMRVNTTTALDTIRELLQNDDVDDKGKPIVPPSVKLQASQFLIEHVIGKPTQRVEQDISVKLQGILGSVMVNPADMGVPTDSGIPGYSVAHYPGVTMELAEKIDDDDDLNPSES